MRQQRVTCPFEPARRLIEPILCGLLLLLGSVPAQASEEPAFPPEVQAKLNAALTQTMTENAIPGCV
ncbi:MAG TPA: hypothetical protein VGQ24_00010, partial [Gemmatimonadales bacterium]|nr:hypothetical protein [Gemmatimonadales bacterium]